MLLVLVGDKLLCICGVGVTNFIIFKLIQIKKTKSVTPCAYSESH